jgi:hypothetical protein
MTAIPGEQGRDQCRCGFCGVRNFFQASLVMPGLVPGIDVFNAESTQTWMAGTSPAMTE